MTDKTLGWTFVAAQGVLLGLLILLPGRSDWPTPGWLTAIGFALVLAGLAIVAIAALRLGPALTATPVPTTNGQLATGGLYRYARHPIYTGVLAIVAGLTIRSGSVTHLVVAVLTVIFFDRKARWEESHLADRYDGYAAYAAVTPRFIPRPWRASGRP